MKRTRLFRHIVWAVLALFGTSALLSALLAAWSLAQMLSQQYRSKGTAIAETIAHASASDQDVSRLQAIVEEYARTEGVAYIVVRNTEGRILVHTFASEVPEELRSDEVVRETQTQVLAIGHEQYIDIAAPIRQGEVGVVRVGMDQAAIAAAMWRAGIRQVLPQGAIGVTALVVAYWLMRRITRPLEQLTRQARKVAALESLYDSPRPVAEELAPIAQRGDEMGQLARAIIYMIETMAQREEDLQTAEETISRRERYYRSLIENISDVILLLGPDGKARYVSPSLHPLLGYESEEWLNRDVSLLVHSDDREAFRKAVNDCLPAEPLEEGGPVAQATSVEVRMLRANGELPIIDVSLNNLLLDQATGGIVVTLRDISDRRRTLELEKAREQAEGADRIKGQLLANISHEFFTPMNHIQGLLQMILDENVAAEMRGTLEMMSTASEDLLGVLRNVLDFSELKEGRKRLEISVFRLATLVSDVRALLGPKAHAKGLHLFCELSSDAPCAVEGDVNKLRQILLHLIGNGIKFTSVGEVRLRITADFEALSRETGVWAPGEPTIAPLLIEVRDTGPGVPEEMQRVIFDPFVQADSSSTRKHGGIGLGLSIARSLVDLMGSRLELQCPAVGGSVFRFALRLRVA